MGSIPLTNKLKKAATSDAVMAGGDPLIDPINSSVVINNPDYYMGVIDGSTPYGDIINAGAVKDFSSVPQVIADKDRRLLTKSEWMMEFIENPNTIQNPVGHGFAKENAKKVLLHIVSFLVIYSKLLFLIILKMMMMVQLIFMVMDFLMLSVINGLKMSLLKDKKIIS